jgi:hypothetical protein
MELSEPAILTPYREPIAARSGKAGTAVDPFFADAKSELSDKWFLVAAADNLIAWARTGSLMWMQFGLYDSNFGNGGLFGSHADVAQNGAGELDVMRENLRIIVRVEQNPLAATGALPICYSG